MVARILFLSVLFTTAGWANSIDCSGAYEHHKIDVEIHRDHDSGILKMDGQELGLRCKKDHKGLNLECFASRATTIYTVKIHRVTRHSRKLWEYKGHLGRTIGGFAGSMYTDLGELRCGEWPDGSFPG